MGRDPSMWLAATVRTLLKRVETLEVELRKSKGTTTRQVHFNLVEEHFTFDPDAAEFFPGMQVGVLDAGDYHGVLPRGDVALPRADGEFPRADGDALWVSDGDLSRADGDLLRADEVLLRADGDLLRADGDPSRADGDLSRADGGGGCLMCSEEVEIEGEVLCLACERAEAMQADKAFSGVDLHNDDDRTDAKESSPELNAPAGYFFRWGDAGDINHFTQHELLTCEFIQAFGSASWANDSKNFEGRIMQVLGTNRFQVYSGGRFVECPPPEDALVPCSCGVCGG